MDIHYLMMYFLMNMVIFHCHVSFRECNMQANMHVPILTSHLSGSLGIYFEIINATADA